ncbi:MAG: ankyrin repeat domain-containing protein [Bacteroidota bacterium]|nr:ankyrin repeat domain-containing protein [Bacteroidota bacterium]
MLKHIFFTVISFLAIQQVSFSQSRVQVTLDKGDSKGLLLWINEGHDIHAPFEVEGKKISPLGYSGLMANPELTKILLDKGANAKQIVEGHDALMFAAKGGNLECIEVLINAGANPTLESFDGKTARDYAYQNKHPEAVKILEQEMTKFYQMVKLSKRK